MAELGEVGEVALAPKKLSAQLFFQLFDGSRERGLRDVTLLGSAGEVQQARYGEEVSDLVHFHAGTPTQSSLSA
jgi:hypothetical protein